MQSSCRAESGPIWNCLGPCWRDSRAARGVSVFPPAVLRADVVRKLRQQKRLSAGSEHLAGRGTVPWLPVPYGRAATAAEGLKKSGRKEPTCSCSTKTPLPQGGKQGQGAGRSSSRAETRHHDVGTAGACPMHGCSSLAAWSCPRQEGARGRSPSSLPAMCRTCPCPLVIREALRTLRSPELLWQWGRKESAWIAAVCFWG